MSDPGEIDETLTSPEGSPSRAAGAAPPALAGRYAVYERLGAGGAGAVYRAVDLELEREVAIKLLIASSTPGPSREQVARLRREARAQALLQHPHVVSIFDVGDGDELFIAMELVAGGSLRDWLDARRSRDEILRVFLEAGEGLLAAHEKGLIHRDFKPSNVLVGEDGRARVADFGLARALEGPADDKGGAGPLPRTGRLPDLTRTGAVLGTPAYMAPEQFERAPVDARADQYAFCLSLGEALMGSMAPRGTLSPSGWSRPDWEPKVWLRKAPVSPELRVRLARGLSRRPEDRYSDLRPILEGLRGQLTRRRAGRQLIFGAAGLFFAVVLPLGLLWRNEPCQNFDRELEPIWSPDRRERLASSRTARGWSEVWSSLDRATTGWVTTRAEVCRATRSQGGQSEALLDVRMACLDRWLNRVEVLLALIEERRIDDPSRGSEALLRLPGPARCREVTLSPGRGVALPPPQKARVERIEQEMVALEALYGAGFFEAGLAEARALSKQAQASGHLPTECRVEGILARFLQMLDRPQEASAAWARASHLADAAGDDALRFQAAIALVNLDGSERSPNDTAAVERAKALVVRRGGAPRNRMTLSAALSRWHFRRGDFARCRELGEEAVALLGQTAGVPLFERLEVQEALSVCLERLGERRRAAGVLRAALRDAQDELGEHHSRVGDLQVALSRALDFSGDQGAAEEEARRGLATLLRSRGRSRRTARAYQALANTMFRKGDFAASVDNLLEARALMAEVRGESSYEVAGIESSLGLSYSYQREYVKAEIYHEAAVAKMTSTLGARHPETGAARGRLGSNLARKGACEEAIPHFLEAKAILKESHPRHARILDQVRDLGSCLVELDRWKEALPHIEEGLELAEHRDEAPLYAAKLDLLAARTYRALGRSREARARAQAALQHLEGQEGPREQALVREIRSEWASDPR